MAQFIGKPSKYLKSNDLKYWLIAAVIFLILVVIFFIIIKKIELFTTSIIGFILLIFLMKIIPDVGETFIDYFQSKSNNFYNGRMGEEDIKNELGQLSDEYVVFRNIVFDDIGDVDFIVVGPSGIFTIDSKDFKRYRVTFDGKQLLFNGRRGKNILWQAIREASHIQRYLIDNLGSRFNIEPVIVFSSYAELHFGFNKQGGVYVVGKPLLTQLITKRSRVLSPEQIEKIRETFCQKVIDKQCETVKI
jgi:hypothetical protein